MTRGSQATSVELAGAAAKNPAQRITRSGSQPTRLRASTSRPQFPHEQTFLRNVGNFAFGPRTDSSRHVSFDQPVGADGQNQTIGILQQDTDRLRRARAPGLMTQGYVSSQC